jgi:chromosome segregation ATPase
MSYEKNVSDLQLGDVVKCHGAWKEVRGIEVRTRLDCADIFIGHVYTILFEGMAFAHFDDSDTISVAGDALGLELKEENEQLGKKVDEVRGWFADHVKTIRELREENASLKEKYFEGPSPLLGIFSQLERIEGLEQENERLRNRVAKLQSLGVVDIDAFEQDIRQLDEFKFHERLTPRKEMFKNIDRLNAQVEELTRERDVLKNVNERFIDKLREQINELTKHNHALAERAKRAEAERDQYWGQRDTLAGVNNRLKFKITSMRNALEADQ